MSNQSKRQTAGNDCYSDGERQWMEWGQRLRAVLLGPLLRLMIRWGVTADGITLLSAVVGVAFVPFALNQMYAWAALCLLIHVLLDGLDGPLAREAGNASSRGSFTDTFADQIVVTCVIVTWMLLHPGVARVSVGATYIFLYTLVVAMSMVRNALAIPYTWLVRPRFFVYASVVSDLLMSTELTMWVVVIANVLLGVKVVTGFFKLRNQLPGPSSEP